MNNVGEAFFSSPVDPTDIMRDWGRSDDDQRHRLVIFGTANTPDGAGDDDMGAHQPRIPGGRHGAVLLGPALQHHVRCGKSAGHQQPASCRRCYGSPNFDVRAVELISRNAGIGNDFFSLNLRISRAFRVGGDVKVEGLVDAFNVTNRANSLTRNQNFGPGAYPTNPVPTFNEVTAVGDPRTFQFGLRLTF